MLINLSAYSTIAFSLLRLVVSIIFFVHGYRKVSAYKNIGRAFTALGLVEVISSIVLAFGLYVQYAAAILSIVILGALYFKIFKWKVKFMEEKSTGWEFDLLLLSALLFILASF